MDVGMDVNDNAPDLYTYLYAIDTLQAPLTATISSLTCPPTSVAGGNAALATATLTSAAPTGGVLISLASSSTAATVPTGVTISLHCMSQLHLFIEAKEDFPPAMSSL